MKKYEPEKIESKWQNEWENLGLYKAKDFDDRIKYYCLDMFPYPSGEGLHVGHWRGYVLSDVWARYQLLQGKNVLHPMGFDAFGLPAENAAIKSGKHPKEYSENSINNFIRQLKQMGAMFDWSRSVTSSNEDYYKWTQWLFIQLYKSGLAYKKKASVNWCPSCQTVLANEQIVDGVCERCGTEATRRDLEQWFFKITEYAQELLDDLEKLQWPERVKTLQRNWIGRSNGLEVNFRGKLNGKEFDIPVFTTRADTIYGVTAITLAPEHPLVKDLTIEAKEKEVLAYQERARKESEIERLSTEKEKTGVFLGTYTINPFTQEKVPVWIGDYVLLTYGTGAVMVVPAHDQRDFEFAKKYGLDIREVIAPQFQAQGIETYAKAYEEPGIMVNSGEFNRLSSLDAGEKIMDVAESRGIGRRTIQYRLRDWLISRQRYWGAPIPIVYCDKCGMQTVEEEDLPVRLPEDVDFKPTGESPLSRSKQFLEISCPKCSGKAMREVDTMDTFVDSSWYYLRYLDSKNSKEIYDRKKVDYWMPVDFYVGGIEHAVLHLLYARFFYKALRDMKLVPGDEPFKQLFSIGMVYLHGAKMSKSKGNVISPDDLIKKYGTDALRGYELFVGPPEQDVEWNPNGIAGVYRFLQKVWQLGTRDEWASKDSDKVLQIINRVIYKVGHDFEHQRLNTAVSALMTAVNELMGEKDITKEGLKKFLVILSPIAPHIAEELWHWLGEKQSIFLSSFPIVDSRYTELSEVTVAVQINGRTRGKILAAPDENEENVRKLAEDAPEISKWLEGKEIVRVIYRPSQIINFVVE